MSENDSRLLWSAAAAFAVLGAAVLAYAVQLYLADDTIYVDALSRFAGATWGLSLTVGAVAWQGRRLSSG
ncbi:hypothetical protein ACIQU6_24310 [Streptomyces sp. NPDC090442]|uniref:hypothetical protein n=1 Tax=Streptomyces sp. NPDC090442 TaxID=3365962 RepID=UPI00380C9944